MQYLGFILGSILFMFVEIVKRTVISYCLCLVWFSLYLVWFSPFPDFILNSLCFLVLQEYGAPKVNLRLNQSWFIVDQKIFYHCPGKKSKIQPILENIRNSFWNNRHAERMHDIIGKLHF